MSNAAIGQAHWLALDPEMRGKITAFFLARINDPEVRAAVVDLINDRVNIPIIGEGVEARLIDAAYGAMAEALETVLS